MCIISIWYQSTKIYLYYWFCEEMNWNQNYCGSSVGIGDSACRIVVNLSVLCNV